MKRQKKRKTGPAPAAGTENTKWGCPYAGKCGGCDYAGMPYDRQLKRKEAFLRETIGEICRSHRCSIEPIVGAEDPFYYRNKVHAALARGPKGAAIRGIYRKNTHHVIPVRGCLLEDRRADAIIEAVTKMIPSFKWKVYDEDTGTGLIRHIMVRTASEGIMLILVTAVPQLPGKNNFVKAIRRQFPEITTIVQNINPRRTSMVLGDRNIILWGKGTILDRSLGMDFRISPSAFYQVNSRQTKKLYALAREMAGLTGTEHVLDAYCGTGTIGLFMAPFASDVTGVELNRHAVKDAAANARSNHIENIRFLCADATEFLQACAADRRASRPRRQNIAESASRPRRQDAASPGPAFDVLCMDPPRTGSTPEFIHAAAALEIPRIVYVSCGPESLARDLKEFDRCGYRIRRVVPVDMFPFTKDVETVCLLEK